MKAEKSNSTQRIFRLFGAYGVFFFICLSADSSAQTAQKKWEQTTARDFLGDNIENVVVTDNSGGEVTLPHSLMKTVADHPVDRDRLFVARDSRGNFIRTWNQGRDVYVRKYSADGNPLTRAIIVSDSSGLADDNVAGRVALFDDGVYIVVWGIQYGEQIGPYCMFGQIFRDDSVKVGNNFGINEMADWSSHEIVALANSSDGLFWLFFHQWDGVTERLYVQKRDKNGEKVGNTALLNSRRPERLEVNPTVIQDGSGFDVAWSSSRNNLALPGIYLARFNSDGSPKSPELFVSDSTIRHGCGSPGLASDGNGNILVVWIDDRGSQPDKNIITTNLYGRLVDSSGCLVGGDVFIAGEGREFVLPPDVDFSEGKFTVSWTSWVEKSQALLASGNSWKYEPRREGTLTSSVFDGGTDAIRLLGLSWNDSIPSGTSLKFRLRSGKSLESIENAEWRGPTGSSDYYLNSSGEAVGRSEEYGRYVQFKAYMSAETGNSPVLYSAAVSYTTSDSIPPSSPVEVTAEPALHMIYISWQIGSDRDIAGYAVYRRTSEGGPALRFALPGSAGSFADTSVKSGTRYIYAVAAFDSSRNESQLSGEVSAVPLARNIYVEANAATSGDGGIGSPFSTIGSALSVAEFGDTLLVLPGTYDEPVDIPTGVSLSGAGAQVCTITGQVNCGDSLVVEGFTFTGVMSCDNASPVITQNIFRIQDQSSSAISVSHGSPLISKNFIAGGSIGINVGFSSLPVIMNNIIRSHDVGISSGSEQKIVMLNNTIMTVDLSGIQVEAGTAVNNIIVGTGKPANNGIVFMSPLSFESFNDFWLSNQGSAVGEMNADPLFVDPAADNYRLSSSSPCRDAGDPREKYKDTDGTRNDLGAYGGPDPYPVALSPRLVRSFNIPGASAFHGDTVSILVQVDNGGAISEAELMVKYDTSVVSFVSSSLTGCDSSWSLHCNGASCGEVVFVLTADTSLASEPADLVEVRFCANGSSLGEEVSPVSLSILKLVDISGNDIIVGNVTDGVVVVAENRESENFIYVNCSNKATGNGSRHNPFRTIGEAMEKAGTGDSILVAAGDYTEMVLMKEGVHVIGSGASVTNILVAGDMLRHHGCVAENIGEGEISGFRFAAAADTLPLTGFIYCNSSDILISGNRFEGQTLTGGIELADSSDSKVERNCFKDCGISVNASAPVIEENTIDAGTQDGIRCIQGASPSIVGNRINSSLGSSAIVIDNSSPSVMLNTITGNDAGWAISVVKSTDTRILNNVIVNKGQAGTGIRLLASSNTTIVNNVIAAWMIGIEEETSASLIYNNIITGSSAFGARFGASASFDYNDMWENGTDVSGTAGGANIRYDPAFSDLSADDFALMPGSPCIDAGNPAAQYNDKDGSRNDIGAFGGPFADAAKLRRGGISLTIDSANVPPADTFTVVVHGGNLKGMASLEIILTYNASLLRFVGAGTGTITRAFVLSKSSGQPGSICLKLFSAKGIIGDSGDILELRFAVLTQEPARTSLRFGSVAALDAVSEKMGTVSLTDGNITINTSGPDEPETIPEKFTLCQNFPNPFNPSTKIRYELPVQSKVTLKVYDVLGREVAVLVDREQPAGVYYSEWNAGKFASGVYFVRIQTGVFVGIRKMLLLK